MKLENRGPLAAPPLSYAPATTVTTSPSDIKPRKVQLAARQHTALDWLRNACSLLTTVSPPLTTAVQPSVGKI